MTSLLSLDAKSAGDPFGLTNYGKLKDDIDLLIREADGILSPGLYKLWDSSEAGVSFPTASITTPALPQTFKHLRVAGILQSDQATVQSLKLRFNGDSGANYWWNVARTAGNSFFGLGNTADTAITVDDQVSGTGASLLGWTSFDLTISDYAAARHVYGMQGVFQSGDSRWNGSFGGEYKGAAGISTLTFLLTNMVANSRFTVYGEA